LKVHIDESGKKNQVTMIYVHGAGGSSKVWSMQLSERALGTGTSSVSPPRGTQRIQPNALALKTHQIALDLNGHGRTPDRRPSDVTESYLEDIDAVVSSCKKPILVGHSMGGALSQLYALKSPGKLGGLVLVGTGARLKVAQMIFDFLDKDPNAYFNAMPKFMFDESTPKTVIEASQAEARKCSVPTIRRDFEVCNAFDLMQEVSRITMRSLIIVGDSDVMTPVKYANYLHEKIAGSELRTIPQAGHAVMLERPSQFNTAIIDWLRA
jgi:pimeloyl-ACP methyl ester carboxylesterase